MENWKTINGFSNYEISDLGRVRSKRRTGAKGGVLKPSLRSNSIYKVELLGSNGKKSMSIHRLVATHFLPNYYNKAQVDHINRNTKDNRVYNLRWVTAMENNLNKKVSSLSTTGKKGVSVNNKGHYKYYFATIRINKQRITKSFKTYEDACKWRDEHVKIYYNEKYYIE